MKNIIKDFNKAMFKAAWKKADQLKTSEDRKCSDIELYRFDFDCRRPIRIYENDFSVPSDRIEYYWIEYRIGKDRMKTALFYKDVDINTHNVHVVPGLFENYKLEQKVPDEMPYADVENGKVIIKNVRDIKIYKLDKNGEKIIDKKGKHVKEWLEYPSFAEHCSDGWWCPQSECIPSANKEIIRKLIETIDNYKDKDDEDIDYFKEFRKNEKKVSSDIYDHLMTAKNVQEISRKWGVTERYWLIGWCNINGISYSVNFTKPIYFWGYGFFTQYHCVDFKKNGKDIIINCQVVTPDTEEFQARSLDKSDPKEVKEAFEDFMRKNV